MARTPRTSRRPGNGNAPGRPALARLGVGCLAGLVAVLAVGFTVSWPIGVLIGWDVAATVIVVWIWWVIWPADAERTATHARREDPARAATDVLLLCASVASLIGAIALVVASGHSHGVRQALLVCLDVATVLISWAVVHTTFTLRYALLYYSGDPGGVDFNQQEPPQYTDFAYLALTLGMTYQVSDTDLTTPAIRATALRQALLSYLFGVVIIAIVINTVVSLGS